MASFSALQGGGIVRRLKFDVKGQKLVKSGDFENVVIGSKNYLQAEFVFDDDWKDMVKVVSFNDVPVLLDANNLAMVPNEVTDVCCIKVKVTGKNLQEVKIVTNTEMFYQVS